MTYITIYIIDNAQIMSTVNFKSTEKANTFFDSLMTEDSTMETFSNTHKKIQHPDQKAAAMYLKTISFQDE